MGEKTQELGECLGLSWIRHHKINIPKQIAAELKLEDWGRVVWMRKDGEIVIRKAEGEEK